jgi:hypothetical protein
VDAGTALVVPVVDSEGAASAVEAADATGVGVLGCELPLEHPAPRVMIGATRETMRLRVIAPVIT